MSEQISALMDDEIAIEDAAHLIAAMHSNKQAAQAWSDYQLIGDVMRGDLMLSSSFRHDLMQKLDQEPTVLAPKAAQHYVEQQQIPSKEKLSVKWSMAASFAAVMVVGFMALQQQVRPGNPVPVMEMAQLQPSQQQSIPNEYLAAHQASAPSASSYYIQTVSYAE